MELILFSPVSDSAGRYMLPNGETIIGRRPGCHITLDAPSISPRHARLFYVDGHAVIYAVDGAHPVYVNGEPIERHVLADGDDIEVGHYLMRYVDAAADSADIVDAEETPTPARVDASTPAASSRTDPGNAAAADWPATEAGDMSPAGPGLPDHGSGGIEDSIPAAVHPASPGLPPRQPRSSDASAIAPTDPATSTTPPADESAAGELSVAAAGETPPGDQTGIEDEAPETRSGDAGAAPTREYHLDILTGINRGRRVALTHDRVVLGFNRQRLVEIETCDGALSLRRVDDEAAAELNGVPITDEPTAAQPGDVISLQRIDLRIHGG